LRKQDSLRKGIQAQGAIAEQSLKGMEVNLGISQVEHQESKTSSARLTRERMERILQIATLSTSVAKRNWLIGFGRTLPDRCPVANEH
jgi:hypothetical protein